MNVSIGSGSGLSNSKLKYNEILDLFSKDYFVDNHGINIPLIYGTKELIFAGLINDLYFDLFTERKKEPLFKSEDDDIEEYDNYSQSIMIKKNKNELIENNINNNINIINMEVECEEENQEFKKVPKSILISRMRFITQYLYRIKSQDFKKVFDIENTKNEKSSNLYECKPNINLMILHLLYFEFILHIFILYNLKLYIKEFGEYFFFETKDEKLKFFTYVIPSESIYITDKKGKQIIIIEEREEDIKNETYII